MTWIDHTKDFGAGKKYGIGRSVFYSMNSPLWITRTKRPRLENFSCPNPAITNQNSYRSFKTKLKSPARNLQRSSLYRGKIDKTRNISSSNLYQDVTNKPSRRFPIKCNHTLSNHKSTRDASNYYNESLNRHNIPQKVNYSHDKFNYNCLVLEDQQAHKDKILKTNRIKPEDFLIDLRDLKSFPDEIETEEIFNPDVKEVKVEEHAMEIDPLNPMIHENYPITSLVPLDLQALEKKLLNTNRIKPEDLLMDIRDLELFLDQMETAEIFNPDVNEVREEENSLGIEPPDTIIQTFQPNMNVNKDADYLDKEEPVNQPIQVINKIEGTIYHIGDHVLLKSSQTHPKWQRGVVTATAEPGHCDVQTMDGEIHKLNVNQLFKTRLPGENAAEIYSIDTEVEDVNEEFMRHLVIPPPEEWAEIIGI